MTTTINPTTHLTAITNTTTTKNGTALDTNPEIVKPRQAAGNISIGRLTRVETRKFVDTRSGKVLLAVAVALALVIGSIAAYYFKPLTSDLDSRWWMIGSLMREPFRILLPVMAALLVTTEWSQRTALTTFTLEPRRGRVLIAKAAVLVVMAIAATILLFGTSAIFSVIGGAHTGVDVEWGLSRTMILPIAVLLVAMAMGFAFGLATMSSPAAIVITVALPTLNLFLSGLGGKVQSILSWVEPETALANTFDSTATAMQWAKFGVAVSIWIIIPAAIGVIRTLRTEVK